MAGELIFKNRLEALGRLQGVGFKIQKSKFYKDAKEGLLRIRSDGSIAESDLMNYAHLAGLQRPEQDGPDHGEVVQVQQEKQALEREELRLRIEQRKFALEKDQGRFILREDLDLELASRAGVFDSGLRTKIKTHARDLVYLVGGKPEKIPEFLQMMFELLDEQMNEFARMDRFEVVFEQDIEEVENQ